MFYKFYPQSQNIIELPHPLNYQVLPNHEILKLDYLNLTIIYIFQIP